MLFHLKELTGFGQSYTGIREEKLTVEKNWGKQTYNLQLLLTHHIFLHLHHQLEKIQYCLRGYFSKRVTQNQCISCLGGAKQQVFLIVNLVHLELCHRLPKLAEHAQIPSYHPPTSNLKSEQ